MLYKATKKYFFKYNFLFAPCEVEYNIISLPSCKRGVTDFIVQKEHNWIYRAKGE